MIFMDNIYWIFMIFMIIFTRIFIWVNYNDLTAT